MVVFGPRYGIRCALIVARKPKNIQYFRKFPPCNRNKGVPQSVVWTEVAESS